jgi:hypothetical protein
MHGSLNIKEQDYLHSAGEPNARSGAQVQADAR